MIPKKIHYCWLSNDDYPHLVKKCIASWKTHLSDYEFILWDRTRFNIDTIPWVQEAFNTKKYAFAADYIRLYALHTVGGIYLDSDVEVLKPFDDLLNVGSFIGYESSGDLEAAIIGSKKNQPWIAECLKYYEHRSFLNHDQTLNTRPLPLIIGECIAKLGESPINYDEIYFSKNLELCFYPSVYFSPKNIHTNKVLNSDITYAIHHFDGHWIDKGPVHALKLTVHAILIYSLGPWVHRQIVTRLRFIINKVKNAYHI